MNLCKKSFRFDGPQNLRVTENSSEIICQGVRLHPSVRRSTVRNDNVQGHSMDRIKRAEPEHKVTLPQVVSRGPQFEPLRPRVFISGSSHPGLDSPRLSLPLLRRFHPSRPLQPSPNIPAMLRTISNEHSGKNIGLCVKNSPGFPRLSR